MIPSRNAGEAGARNPRSTCFLDSYFNPAG